MKEVTLKIPDNKYSFFMELIKSLGFVKVAEEISVPEEHKSIVRERIMNSKEEDLISWQEGQKRLNIKGKVQ